MQHQNRFLLFSAVLLLLAAQGCQSRLMCYVCDNCAKVTATSKLETCDESFFHNDGTELPSTMTTTQMTTMAETTTMASSPTTMMTTTTEATTKNTTTTATSSTQSTEPPVPTPPTLSPVETTTAMPTPPLMGTVPVMMEQMSSATVQIPVQINNAMVPSDQAAIYNYTTFNNSGDARDYTNSSEFRVRQTRHTTAPKANGISYHCYTLQLTTNTKKLTQRGCARVTVPESVCGQLQMLATNETTINKCKYCSTNRCNGSSALGISAVTLLVALVASFLKNA